MKSNKGHEEETKSKIGNGQDQNSWKFGNSRCWTIAFGGEINDEKRLWNIESLFHWWPYGKMQQELIPVLWATLTKNVMYDNSPTINLMRFPLFLYERMDTRNWKNGEVFCWRERKTHFAIDTQLQKMIMTLNKRIHDEWSIEVHCGLIRIHGDRARHGKRSIDFDVDYERKCIGRIGL